MGDVSEGELGRSHVLESLDREIAFNRKRSGQVFLLGLTSEATLMISQQKFTILPGCAKAVVLTTFFLAVALVGIALGAEFRSRIWLLKDERDTLLEDRFGSSPFPHPSTKRLSEILVMYFVLGFLSLTGIAIAWLELCKSNYILWTYVALAATLFLTLCVLWVWPSKRDKHSRQKRRAKKSKPEQSG